jgi:hypothetical protein
MMPMMEASRARWTDQYLLVSIATGEEVGTVDNARVAAAAAAAASVVAAVVSAASAEIAAEEREKKRSGLYVRNVRTMDPYLIATRVILVPCDPMNTTHQSS